MKENDDEELTQEELELGLKLESKYSKILKACYDELVTRKNEISQLKAKGGSFRELREILEKLITNLIKIREKEGKEIEDYQKGYDPNFNKILPKESYPWGPDYPTDYDQHEQTNRQKSTFESELRTVKEEIEKWLDSAGSKPMREIRVSLRNFDNTLLRELGQARKTNSVNALKSSGLQGNPTVKQKYAKLIEALETKPTLAIPLGKAKGGEAVLTLLDRVADAEDDWKQNKNCLSMKMLLELMGERAGRSLKSDLMECVDIVKELQDHFSFALSGTDLMITPKEKT